MMTIKQRRVKVLEKILDDAMSDEVGYQIGIATKKIMLLRMGEHPMAKQIEAALQSEEMQLTLQPTVIELLQKKLEEATEDARIESTKD